MRWVSIVVAAGVLGFLGAHPGHVGAQGGFAAAGKMDVYRSRLLPSRANGIDRIVGQAVWLFLRESSERFKEGRDADDGSFLCSMRRSMPLGRGAAFHELLADRLADLLRRDRRGVLIALTGPDRCKRRAVEAPSAPRRRIFTIDVDAKRRVVSPNPVWNACVGGGPLSFDLIQSNADVAVHRQRSVTKNIPLSCRDYHRGPLPVWTYPGHPDVLLLLDRRGRYLGGMSDDWIVVPRFRRAP